MDTTLKQGGGGRHQPYSKAGGWGVAVSWGAQPNLFPICITMHAQSRSPKGDPRCNMSKRSERTFGGNSTKPFSHRGWAGGPLVTCQNKGDAIPGRPASLYESAKARLANGNRGNGAPRAG